MNTDADRLDWLQSHEVMVESCYMSEYKAVGYGVFDNDGWPTDGYWRGPTLRDAIDAAMAADKSYPHPPKPESF